MSGLPSEKALERLQVLGQLAVFMIKMHGDEVQLRRNLFGHEAGGKFPEHSKLQGTSPTVTKCRLSHLRIAATSVWHQARAIEGRGRPFWSSVMTCTK